MSESDNSIIATINTILGGALLYNSINKQNMENFETNEENLNLPIENYKKNDVLDTNSKENFVRTTVEREPKMTQKYQNLKAGEATHQGHLYPQNKMETFEEKKNNLNDFLTEKNPEDQFSMSHHSSLDLSRRKFYTHARKSDTDDLLLVKQLRGDDPNQKIIANLDAYKNAAPGAIKRLIAKKQNKDQEKTSPSDLVGYNVNYKLPDRYYYESKKTNLFDQVTLKSNSNIQKTLEDDIENNQFQMGTTYRIMKKSKK